MTILSMQTGFAEVNGGAIYYEVAGAGQPVVLIHGANLDCRMWVSQFAELAKRYRVLRFDLRGLGKTAAATEEFTNYDDIRALLDHLEMEQVFLVGHSFGGYTAAECALVYPERVAGLVLSSTGIGAAPSEESLAVRARFQEVTSRGDWEAAIELTLEAYVDGIGQAPDRVDPHVRELYREMTRHAFQLPRGKMPNWLKPAPAERIGELQMPLLTLVGGYDFPEYERTADLLVSKVPHAQKVTFPTAAHSLPMECAAEWNREVIEFIERHQ